MKSSLFKKVIAGAATLAMASQFAFAIPASAEDLYTQDYESVTDASKVMTSASAQAQVGIGTDTTHGNYLKFDFSSTSTNSRGAFSDFTGLDVSAKDKYIIEFDSQLTAGNNQQSDFTVKGSDLKYISNNVNYGAESGWIIHMTTTNSTEWTLNETKKVTVPNDAWCHFKLYVDKEQKLVSTTITNSTTNDVLADKVISSYNGNGNVSGLYVVGGRYNPYFAWDNIKVRDVEADDVFGELQAEVLSSVELSTTLTSVSGKIPQPAENSSNDYTITAKAIGDRLGDLTEKATVEWSFKGLDTDDGYVTITDTDKATVNINVRNGVSTYYVVATAKVTYGEKEIETSYPFAIIGDSNKGATQIVPEAGYPTDMNKYPESLVGYVGQSKDLNSKDIILDNWSIYGSNSARTLKLVKDSDGVKSLEFASNGGGGSTVGVYQWTAQKSQYIIDMTVKFTGDATFGLWDKTPNNANVTAEASISYAAGAISAGTSSVSGINTDTWYRIVMSVDPSTKVYQATVYDAEGTLIGKTDEVPTNATTPIYMCFSGTFPMYVQKLEAYTPTISTISINSDTDMVKVPESGEEAKEVVLSAAVADTNGTKMTGAVDWSLEEEYANVEIESTGAQTAKLTIKAGASGTIKVVATKDGKTAGKEINLTTSSNVVAFTSSASSITIPFDGEDAVVADFKAETRDGSGNPIDGGAITYSLLGSDGATETTVKGVTFENGKLTVNAGANSAIVYVKATNAEGLSTKVKVNIHGLSFAFGSQEPADGYTQVTDTQYTEKLGYGFTDPSSVTVNEANVTSTSKVQFKANVPNGNYVVNISSTQASITSEIVESVTAETGISKSGEQFQVAVCDGVLDLTFGVDTTTTAVQLDTLSITQAAAKQALPKPKVYAVGDSTTNNTNNGAYSWGNCVASGYVTVPEVFSGFSNNGKAGDDSVVYYNAGRIETVLLAVCPGDYVTVNMGINSKAANEGSAYYTMMSDYYVKGIIQRGATPIIVTATPDGVNKPNTSGSYDEATGKFDCDRGDGARNGILRQIAKEQNLDVIELGQWGEDYFNSLTMDDVTAYNAANGTDFTTVLAMVESWYVDHNHYKQPLGEKIGEYILAEVAKIAFPEPPVIPTVGDITYADSKVTVPMTLTAEQAEKGAKVNVIVAEYTGEGGEMLGVAAKQATINAESGSVEVEYAQKDAANIVKIFVVEADTIAPCANAKVITPTATVE